MGIADELKQLTELLQAGSLTNEEFAQAKMQLLANPTPTTGPSQAGLNSLLADQLAEVRFQNELARVDREWEIERRQYELGGRTHRRFIPTIGTGIATAVVGGIGGAFWAAFTYATTQGMSEFGFHDEVIGGNDSLIAIIMKALPWFGVVFAVVAIGQGIYYAVVAQNHNSAIQRYQSRRQKVISSFAADQSPSSN